LIRRYKRGEQFADFDKAPWIIVSLCYSVKSLYFVPRRWAWYDQPVASQARRIVES
jgi:hypothetical protein